MVVSETVLEELGFTKAETKTYLALLELGQTKTGPLIKKSRLQSSVVYNSLQSLKEKGLISWITKGKIKYYQATDPHTILSLLDERKKRFHEILPQLLVKQKKAEEKFEAEVYEGTKAVLGMLLDILKDAKPKQEYLFFALKREGFDEQIQKFFEKYDLKRIEKKLIVKGIAPKDMKPFFAPRVKKGRLKVRYVSYPILNGISIFHDTIATVVWSEGSFSAVLIRSKAVANSYKKFFYEVWGHSRRQ